jgi:hypothetical protein
MRLRRKSAAYHWSVIGSGGGCHWLWRPVLAWLGSVFRRVPLHPSANKLIQWICTSQSTGFESRVIWIELYFHDRSHSSSMRLENDTQTMVKSQKLSGWTYFWADWFLLIERLSAKLARLDSRSPVKRVPAAADGCAGWATATHNTESVGKHEHRQHWSLPSSWSTLRGMRHNICKKRRIR